MNQHSNPDEALQGALNTLREYLRSLPDHTPGDSIMISVSEVLVNHGFTHSEAQRWYSAMKRLDFITVIKTGKAYKIPTIKVDMSTSVEQRRNQRRDSRKKHQQQIGLDAEIALVDAEIEATKARLAKLESDKERLMYRKIDIELQPTG